MAAAVAKLCWKYCNSVLITFVLVALAIVKITHTEPLKRVHILRGEMQVARLRSHEKQGCGSI